MHYVVLGGGTSSEREVSLRSARAVVDTLSTLGHQVTYLDPHHDSLEDILTQAKQSDGVLPILHGTGGEDGTLQRELERHSIPYLGSASKQCKQTFNKVRFKETLNGHGVSTPRSAVVTPKSFAHEPLTREPYVIKPIEGGSSIDTFIVRDLRQDTKDIEIALERYGSMLIEELIVGQEVTVGILNDKALPVIEIIPPDGGDFDYENKYNGATQELCPAKNVDPETQRRAQALALQVHTLMGCRHLSRTDILINAHKELYVIDTNIMPGLTDQSLFPKAAAVSGLSWPELVETFTQLIEL